ncbi:toll/interleukin-1 receptor domain-containing protein [Okeania sp. SIO1H2]|uniref:toll/interleukin-1 receptor domain-containing protein n=2 Tax=Okeania TaxID=1458928 RepID=UPI00257C98E0|nr:toll/interleukin-1 receptor domain-containing protein [Okeania sp. SIO1H2]
MSEYYNAFISYGRADSKSFATKLYEKLTENGLKIWFDQNDIPLGVDFQNQIDDGIIKADNFLFIIAPHSINSPYCLKEIVFGRRKQEKKCLLS